MKTMSDLVEALNLRQVGKEVKSEVDRRFGDLVKYGMPPRNVSANTEFVLKDVISKIPDLEPYVTGLQGSATSFCDGHLVKTPFGIKAVNLSKKENCNLNASGAILWTLTANETFAEDNKDLTPEYPFRFDYAANYAKSNNIEADFSYLILDKHTWLFKSFSLRTISNITFNRVKTNWAQSVISKNVDSSIQRTTQEWVDYLSHHIHGYNY